MITTPITVTEAMTLAEINAMREERRFSFHSFPVLGADGRLAGIITQNDFDFCGDLSLVAGHVMTRDPITAGLGTTIDEAYAIMQSAKKKVLPLVDAEGHLLGMYLYSDLKRIKSGTSAGFSLDAQARLQVAAAVGTGDDALRRVELLKSYVDVIVIDTAHGDSQAVFDTLKEIKHNYDLDVVVGNVSEGSSAKRLVDAGADGVKVGQGPGSICTTRIVAGIGCPQVTAIYNVVRELEGSGIPVCADGGIEYSGDLAIAIGAGAHTVMLGKLFAGTEEAPGEAELQSGRWVKFYRGMGSPSAMRESASSRERYRQATSAPGKLVPEGIEAMVPYVGGLSTVMHQYLGGLRAGMGYVGAATIEELRQKADFWRISAAGMAESHPHGVQAVGDSSSHQFPE